MFDTNLVIVGNLLTDPEWRQVPGTGDPVVNFRLASTSRRYNRESGDWVDGRSLRIRVTAWRRLADGVASSLKVGDPVVVYGRLYNNDWVDENGGKRVSYEMEALAVGHDLSKGRASFERVRPVLVADPQEEPPAPEPEEETPDTADDLTVEVQRLVEAEQETSRRSRRTKREPVAA